MLPIHLKTEIRPLFRAAGLGMTLFLAINAYFFWKMSGARLDGLSLAFPPGHAILFGYAWAPFKPSEYYLRIECVGLTLMFVGFAIWFLRLALGSSTDWTITDHHIERRCDGRIGRKRDVWALSHIVETRVAPFNSRVKSVWTVRLKLVTGQWLKLPWVASKAEAESIRQRIVVAIGRL